MEGTNSNEKRDCFNSYLVGGAKFTSGIELPIIQTSSRLPSSLIRFSDAYSKNYKNFDRFVHFYEMDSQFERIWNNPKAYLNRLKKFEGMITPDFSLYREMPLCMQEWNTYRGRAFGFWLSQNGVSVIPNVRWGDERTYDFCFDGIDRKSTVAIGTHGCIKRTEDKHYFKLGLVEMLKRLEPKTLIVFGKTPSELFDIVDKSKTAIMQFESEFSLSRKQVVA